MGSQEIIEIIKPDEVPENLAEQAAARLAHKHGRTIHIAIHPGPNQRELIIGPNHPITKIPSDFQLAMDFFQKLREARAETQKWTSELEDKLLYGK